MIGMSRLGTATIRAGQVVSPRALTAAQEVTGQAVAIPGGATRVQVDFDIPEADQRDPAKLVTVFVEMSPDGVQWFPRCFATTYGSVLRQAGKQPMLGTRLPAGMTHVRQRVVVGTQGMTCGQVVRFT